MHDTLLMNFVTYASDLRGTMSRPKLKAVADRSACCGYGICAEICPTVFKLDNNGFVTVAVPEVPADLETQAREAAAACPQSALAIEEI
jgi:ferredoxin